MERVQWLEILELLVWFIAGKSSLTYDNEGKICCTDCDKK